MVCVDSLYICGVMGYHLLCFFVCWFVLSWCGVVRDVVFGLVWRGEVCRVVVLRVVFRCLVLYCLLEGGVVLCSIDVCCGALCRVVLCCVSCVVLWYWWFVLCCLVFWFAV